MWHYLWKALSFCNNFGGPEEVISRRLPLVVAEISFPVPAPALTILEEYAEIRSLVITAQIISTKGINLNEVRFDKYE